MKELSHIAKEKHTAHKSINQKKKEAQYEPPTRAKQKALIQICQFWLGGQVYTKK